MQATVMYGAGDVRVETVADARLNEPADALVVVTLACICGSDLWPYTQMEPGENGQRMGHEFIGVVEAVGADVQTVKAGDVVVAPFAYSDGTCIFCHEGLHTSCLHGGFWARDDVDGGQGEAVRVPQADGTRVVLPVGKARLGSERIIILGRHPERIALAREFGATDVVSERGDETVERVRELTDGFDAHSVLECVGHEQSTLTALGLARPGSAVGRVGLPQEGAIPTTLTTFFDNVGIGGGPAPARAYIGELPPDVLEGTLGPVACSTGSRTSRGCPTAIAQ
jgi:threonine dehydrogenase-like Zn-dependent dehydrogenase